MKCEYVDYFHAAILQKKINDAICLALEVNWLSLPCLYKTQLKSDTFTNLNSNFLSREEEGDQIGGGKELGHRERHEIYAYRVCRARSVEYRNKLTTHHFGLGRHDSASGGECVLSRGAMNIISVCVCWC